MENGIGNCSAVTAVILDLQKFGNTYNKVDAVAANLKMNHDS